MTLVPYCFVFVNGNKQLSERNPSICKTEKKQSKLSSSRTVLNKQFLCKSSLQNWHQVI